MASFLVAFTRREPIEGGWSDEAQDSGNWTGGAENVGELVGTNRGVTAWEYKKFLGHEPTVEEMKNMPREHAMSIFKPKYWDKMRGDEINDQESANNIYDLCVNSGVTQGVVLAQRSLGIAESGKMDDFTLNKLNNKG